MTTHPEGRKALTDKDLADLTQRLAETAIERNCRCEGAEAENERLRLLLTECAEDIRSYVDHEYPEASRAQYPSIERRWIRDMELVWRVRAAVETKGTGDE